MGIARHTRVRCGNDGRKRKKKVENNEKSFEKVLTNVLKMV